jgi:dienelactone hydrolase
MSIDDSSETATKAGVRRSDRGRLELLRVVALVAIVAGALGSVALMLYAGRRNSSQLLRVLFTLWVVSPFVILAWANVVSKRWSVLTRATLHVVTLAVALGSLAVYAAHVMSPPNTQAAFLFVVVPPASWLFIALVVLTAALMSRRRDGRPMFKTRLVRGLFKAFAVLAILSLLGVGTLLGSIWLEQRTEVSLPTPTGPFPIGRAIYDWTDDATLDPLAPVPGTKRELLVWIWFPSATGASSAIQDYLPAQMRAAAAPSSGLFRLLTRDVSKVHGHSTRDSDLSAQSQSYPVVIMRAGGSAEVWSYSTLAEDLASHGYVVVGFDAPYRTMAVVFPDGRVIKRTPENNPEHCEGKEHAQQGDCVDRVLTAWTADIGFVLDRLERLNSSDESGKFTGRFDMTRVGVFGHSFGGATAARFCHDDPRCKAGIDVDGQPFGTVVREGLHQPFMFLLSDQIHSSDPEIGRVLADIQSIYDHLPPDGRVRIAIRGANHFLFSDDGAILKSHIVRGTLRMLGLVGIDGRRQLAVTAYCVRTFFDGYLKGPSVSPLKISSPLYPEIQVLE